jgi:hypothetical protein
LAASADHALPFLKERLRPVPPDTDASFAPLIADFGGRSFTGRQKAERELEKIGEAAVPAIRRALLRKPEFDTRRRMENLLERLVPKRSLTASELRTVRAVEVLEHVGTSEARQILKDASGGLSEALLTREASAALARLPGPLLER